MQLLSPDGKAMTEDKLEQASAVDCTTVSESRMTGTQQRKVLFTSRIPYQAPEASAVAVSVFDVPSNAENYRPPRDQNILNILDILDILNILHYPRMEGPETSGTLSN